MAPSVYAVHGALITTQLIFGGGSVVGKLGVAAFNPMLFALIRESIAGVLLLLWAIRCDGCQHLKRPKDCFLFLACGLFIFSNQAFFIVGDKLAGAVLASAWQPTQPVITLLIALLLGWEALSLGKALGILVSVGGAAFMVTYGQDFGSSDAGIVIAGNVLFFLNCLGTSLYVITCKVVLARGYPPSTITAWSYLCGAVMMAGTASGLNSDCRMISFMCPVKSGEHASHRCDGFDTSCAPWSVPSSAIGPLAYWILLNSCVAYWLMTWANKHAQAGFVLAYCALQPLTATALSVVIVSTGAQTDLTMPGWNALGAIPIVIGLSMIIQDGQRAHAQELTTTSAPVSNRDPLLVNSTPPLGQATAPRGAE